jgi:hypothetical protein
MAMLQMFDFDFHSLLGSGANSLRNVVSMDAELHDEWDDLAFWFEEVDGKVCLFCFCCLLNPEEHFYSPTPTTS